MKALNLSRRSRERGAVNKCRIPFSTQTRSNNTSDDEPPGPNRPVNTFPLSVKICSAPRVASTPPATPHTPDAPSPVQPLSPTPQTGSCHQYRSSLSPPPHHPDAPHPPHPSATTPSADPVPTALIARRRRRLAGSIRPLRTNARYTLERPGTATTPRVSALDDAVGPQRGSHRATPAPALLLRRHLMRHPCGRDDRPPDSAPPHHAHTDATRHAPSAVTPHNGGHCADHRPIQDLSTAR